MVCMIVKTNQDCTHHKNLGWIHRNTDGIVEAHLNENDGGGDLHLYFENGDMYFAEFASFTVLKRHIQAWRNLHTDIVKLFVQNIPSGIVSRDNPALK